MATVESLVVPTTTIADVIRDKHDAIVHCWTVEATRAAAARGLSAPEIANIMPELLASLAELREDGALTPESRRTVEAHVRSRLRQGFVVAEIVHELALLGQCIYREAARVSDSVSAEQSARLDAVLQTASVLVVDLFTRQMLDDEQLQKRYLRLLHAAVAPSHRGTTSISAGLADVAALILEAMGASSVAVSIEAEEEDEAGSGARGGAVVEKVGSLADAAAGPSEERQALRAFLQDPASPARSTATAPAEQMEVAPIDMMPDTALYGAGVRSIFGVRVGSHVGLIGTICVATHEERPHASQSELARLESFAIWLALHLDNASLIERLNEQIARLGEERELRDRFVAVLAHDLRGPLTAAKLTTLLLQKKNDPEAAEHRLTLLQRLGRSLDRVERMVSDLLDANRVHAGERLSIEISECRLSDIARDVVDELRAEHGDRFVVDVDDDVVGYWSSDQLRRALWNLAVNAIKYGSAAAPVRIAVARCRLGARVSVHNAGRPIPAAEVPALFRAYGRTRRASASSTRGWGLGLALVRGCAEAHGGRVVVDSTAEAGTTFALELPLDARPFQPAGAGDAHVPP